MTFTDIIWLWVGIVTLVGAIMFNVWYDYGIWKDQLNNASNTRPHKKGWRLKALTSLPAVFSFAFSSNFIWIIALAASIILCGMWFMFLFDGFYNIKRSEPFFFRGTEDGKGDAGSDNFWQSMPQWLHITLKIVLSFGVAALYYVGLSV